MDDQLRSRVYRTLANTLRPPGMELAQQIVDGRLRELVETALRDAGPLVEPFCQRGTPGQIRERLQAEYYYLFQDPRQRVELAESFYKPWASEGTVELPFARSRGLLMGEPAHHLLEIYRLTGYTTPIEFAGRPDHLVSELDFMVYLMLKVGPEDQLQFLDDHLDWLPDLAQRAAAWEDRSPFYAHVVQATLLWVESDRRTLAALVSSAASSNWPDSRLSPDRNDGGDAPLRQRRR